MHGYHEAAEDGEIYIPGIKKILNPALYPFGDEFFLKHAHMTVFGELVAESVRLLHLPVDPTIFLWYLASTFLTLLACWEWAAECFEERECRLAAVSLVTALLTLPVAGTALYISDQYVTPRSVALFSLLFATRNAWRGRYGRFAAWSAFAGAIHPLMAIFGISLGLLLILMKNVGWKLETPNVSLIMVPLAALFPVSSDAYQKAIHTRSYFFILQWHWYEWLGILGPLVLLWWFTRISPAQQNSTISRLSWSLLVYGTFYFGAELILTIPRQFDTFARIQPMRSLHLLYTFLIVLGGGLLGRYVLKKHLWRWALLFAPLCAGMWFAQRQIFPSSAHIEWPGAEPANDWLRSFEWIRRNTPADATFGIDPDYMLNDDQHGFRAIAERSRLADAVKDSGAVSMFPAPPFAEHWLEQLNDEAGWKHFQLADLERLRVKYGVTWVVLQRPGIPRLPCPYQNDTIMVCRVE